MRSLNTAMGAEWLKLHRSVVARLSTLLLLVMIPGASIGFVALARSGRALGPNAAQFEPLAVGPLATAHLSVAAQVLPVAILAAGGFTMAWTFGREFTVGTAGAMSGLAVPRGAVALAKCLVSATWLAVCVVGAIGITVALSALVAVTSGEVFDGDATRHAGVALAAAFLGVGLSLPFGWVATVTRSPFGTVGVLIGLVAATQFAVVLGVGAWFPYAAPELWAGMAGPEAAADIGPLHLALAAAVAPVGVAAVVRAWRRLTDV